MYKLRDSGKGKLFCYINGCVALNENLPQKTLKELFKNKCIYVYEQATTEQEASTQEPVRSEEKHDTSNGSIRRKTNRRKSTRKPKTD